MPGPGRLRLVEGMLPVVTSGAVSGLQMMTRSPVAGVTFHVPEMSSEACR
jgi:hypothetical protein